MSALTITPLPQVNCKAKRKATASARKGHLYVVPDPVELSPLPMGQSVVSVPPKKSPKIVRGAETKNATFADLDDVPATPITWQYVFTVLALVATAMLIIFGVSENSNPQQVTAAEVVNGESLFSIAQKISPAGADLSAVVYEIKQLNGLTSNHLEVGQTLLLPVK